MNPSKSVISFNWIKSLWPQGWAIIGIIAGVFVISVIANYLCDRSSNGGKEDDVESQPIENTLPVTTTPGEAPPAPPTSTKSN
nr:hypothetical protein Iba_chr02aCG0310 [Ipomoea batatas]